MHNQFEQERQVTAIIQKYHREPIRAQQLRLARTERPNPVSTVTSRLRTTITSLLMKPRPQQASPAFTEPVSETADSTATL